MLVARLSLRPGLAAEREVLMVSSSAGMVLVSSRQGTVPFSFSSSIWGGQSRDLGWRGAHWEVYRVSLQIHFSQNTKVVWGSREKRSGISLIFQSSAGHWLGSDTLARPTCGGEGLRKCTPTMATKEGAP